MVFDISVQRIIFGIDDAVSRRHFIIGIDFNIAGIDFHAVYGNAMAFEVVNGMVVQSFVSIVDLVAVI